MAILDEDALKKDMKGQTPQGAYLLYGDEAYLKKLYAQKLVKAGLSDGPKDFNLHSFDGAAASAEEIADACESLPVMSERNVVFVRDLRFDSLSADEMALLEDEIRQLPDTTLLIVWQDSLPFTLKSSAKAAKAIRLFEKYGRAVQIEKRTGSALIKPMIAGAAKRGCTLDNITASYLVSMVGDEYNIIFNELEKLCSYVREGTVTKADVDAVCVRSTEATAFDLVKAIIANHADKVNKLIDTLFEKKTEPILILGAMINAYVDMYRAKVAIINGKPDDYFTSYFNYKGKEFRLRNAARDSSALSIEQLRKSLDILYQADMSLKTEYSAADVRRLTIEKTAVRLMLASKEA